ncbi:MAG TPA: tetratricopeptide repeat protein [Candidatus Margulisiibacteriota bacterium]|nr:tetratricopeptide repeat protein [Candidatus Margulisiibacteriota bacterium]
MQLQSFRKMIFVLMGVLLLTVSCVYAQTAEEYVSLAIANINHGDLTQAISNCDKAIEINPRYAPAYNFRGFAYYQQGRFYQAIPNFTKATEINPAYVEAYNYCGLSYLLVKDYDSAWLVVHKIEKLGNVVNPDLLNALKKESGREK